VGATLFVAAGGGANGTDELGRMVGGSLGARVGCTLRPGSRGALFEDVGLTLRGAGVGLTVPLGATLRVGRADGGRCRTWVNVEIGWGGLLGNGPTGPPPAGARPPEAAAIAAAAPLTATTAAAVASGAAQARAGDAAALIASRII
jgi:hypothetical protein